MSPERLLCNNFAVNLLTNCNYYYRVYESKLPNNFSFF